METSEQLMSIGAFARASRLSPKALRLYDELGLLPPARVDPGNGYRMYAPGQLETARLVAWLRRLGMPLARIREVCALREADASAAAGEVRAYWAQVEAETAVRRDLAAFLVDHLSRKDATAMSATTPSGTGGAAGRRPGDGPLAIRYAALSDTGLVRDRNQDAAYAGARLLAVADGFGTGGAAAAAGAIDALRPLESEGASAGVPAGDLLNVLRDAVDRAGDAVPDAGSGTTLTAMLWTGSQLALVHIGDSRAYLLRDGELFLITHDHTYVQSLVDEGRLTAEEAASHPQRALLVRALSQGPGNGAGAEVRLQDARSGDRYLLCSDGLSAVVDPDAVRRVVASAPDPDVAVRELVALAHESGGPDNVSCVVADVVAAAA